MPESPHNGTIKFEGPGKYRIIVQGKLNESWSDRLGGMQIISDETEGASSKTTLIGYLRDQTQLSGVLNSLYELHLAIRLVEHLVNESGEIE